MRRQIWDLTYHVHMDPAWLGALPRAELDRWHADLIAQRRDEAKRK